MKKLKVKVIDKTNGKIYYSDKYAFPYQDIAEEEQKATLAKSIIEKNKLDKNNCEIILEFEDYVE